MKGHVLGTLLCNYIGFIASASQDRLTFSVVWQMTSKGEVRVPQHPSTCTVCSYIYLHSTPCSYYVHCVQLPISTSIGKYFAFQVELTSEVQAVIRDCGIHNRCTGGYMHSLFCVVLLCMKYLCETVSSYIVQLKWILIAEACK